MSFFRGVSNEQLAGVKLLDGLDPAAIEAIKTSSYFIGAHPGFHIIRKDDAGFELYVILSGTADVIRDGQVIASLGKGDIFGEMALLGSLHRSADVVATSVMSLISLTAQEFRRLAANHPEFEQRVRDLAESRNS